MTAREAAATKRRATRTATRTGARARARRQDTRTNVRISASGARFGLFTWTYLRQTKGGRFAGRPLGLELFQIEITSELLKVETERWRNLTVGDIENLGGLHEDRERFWRSIHEWRADVDTAGWRVYREGILGVPKKNGKSTLGSGLALYLLVADDEPGAEIYSTAAAKDQARIVFRQAREMAEASPKLLERVRIYRDAIEHPSTNSFYKVVAADADLQEGINPHAVINDEVHAQPSRDLYDTIRSATIARDQPLIFSITTAGVSLKAKDGSLTIGGDLYTRGAGRKPKVVAHKLGTETFSIVEPRADKPPGFYFRWYEVPWRNRENPAWWKRANPAPWITPVKLQDESDVERPRGIFYRYHTNIWSRVEKHWLPAGAWAKLHAPTIWIASPRQGVVITVDIGLWYDTTALVVARPGRAGEEGDASRIPVRAMVWGVHENPALPPPPAHKLLDEGPIDLDMIEDTIRKIARGGLEPEIAAQLELTGPTRVIAIGADPHKFETQLQRLDKSGFNVFRFDQGPLMTKASEALYRAATPRRNPDPTKLMLAHNGDVILQAHMENATAKDIGNGRWRLDKKSATEKMDAGVATAMNVYMCGNDDIVRTTRPSVSVLT